MFFEAAIFYFFLISDKPQQAHVVSYADETTPDVARTVSGA